MAKTIKTWHFSHGKDGFRVHIYETSFLRYIIGFIIESVDFEWWGEYKNFPFCWINPWSWTWKIGTENYNLGNLWRTLGNRVMNFSHDLQFPEELNSFPVADKLVREKFPKTWDWSRYWEDD